MPHFGGGRRPTVKPEHIDPYRQETLSSGIALTTDNPAAEQALDAAAERAKGNR